MRRYTSRYIPQDSVMVAHPKGAEYGAVYTYTDKQGRPAAVAYWGKQSKCTWHHCWIGKDPIGQRESKIAGFFAGIDSHAQMLADRKASRMRPHSIPIGAIVRNTWGYDQTNVDFYQVVKTSAKFVFLRRISCTVTETGFMCGDTTPVPNSFVGEDIIQKKAESDGYVHFPHGCGKVWDGKPERCSWYA